MPNGGREESALFSGRCIGIILLLMVNVLWVLSSEITRFIFVDENFKRPFFVAYLKNSLLVVYMIRYLFVQGSATQNIYKVLDDVSQSDMELSELNESDQLSLGGFETLSSESEESHVERSRSISFAQHREVRRLPSSQAEDARAARQPYRQPALSCPEMPSMSRHMKYTVFFFGPMWLICSFTYQSALMFTSVSSLNLISSSSSLFILIFSICLPSRSSRFTLFKAIMVAMNIGGVLLVSSFSISLTGAIFAQIIVGVFIIVFLGRLLTGFRHRFGLPDIRPYYGVTIGSAVGHVPTEAYTKVSAVAYALYLTLYTRYQEKHEPLDMNLMFGSIGVLAVLLGTPLILLLDKLDVEVFLPLPDSQQTFSILVSAVIGTLLADYLWLLAAGLTDSLSASLSLTLSIPFSFLADTLLRSRPPTGIELLASIPITLSFIGAAISEHRSSRSDVAAARVVAGGGDEADTAALLEEDE